MLNQFKKSPNRSGNSSTGVSLMQRSVDFQHEAVFAGRQQGPQPDLPPGC
jgi:hypothetical protein